MGSALSTLSSRKSPEDVSPSHTELTATRESPQQVEPPNSPNAEEQRQAEMDELLYLVTIEASLYQYDEDQFNRAKDASLEDEQLHQAVQASLEIRPPPVLSRTRLPPLPMIPVVRVNPRYVQNVSVSTSTDTVLHVDSSTQADVPSSREESAVRAVENISDRLEESTNCPICLLRFDDPRMLTCGHTFCLGCLQRCNPAPAYSTIISCSLCRRRCEVPRGGLDALPRDLRIAEMIEMQRLLPESAETQLST